MLTILYGVFCPLRCIGDRVNPVDVYDFAYEILDGDTNKSIKIWNDLYRKKKKEWREKDLDYFGNIE